MSDIVDGLGPGPDIGSIDLNSMDFGNEPEPAATQAPEPTPAPTQAPAETPAPTQAPGETQEPEAPEETEEPPRDDKGRFTGKGTIPIDRHKATLEKEREAREAAERRAAELERQLAEREAQRQTVRQLAEVEAQIEALEQKHADMLLDGNVKEATAIMKQIRTMERQIAVAEAEQRANAATAQALEAERAAVIVARIEADFPEMNPQSESYDQDIVDLVLSKQQNFLRQGMAPSQALDRAAREVADRFLKNEPPKEKVEPKGLDTSKTAEERRKQAVEQALATQKQQPASMRETGMDSDKMGEKGLPDVTKMTAEEFAALPEATKARMLGNLV